MKKFIRNSISILLAVTALGSVACSDKKQSVTLPPYDTMEYTDYVLAESGKTDYAVMIAEDASEYETFALSELQKLFKEATGANLPVVKEGAVSFSEDAKIISIGDTQFQKDSGVTATYDELKSSGNKVVNKGQSVILVGGSDEGSLYAVYDFLGALFNYDYFDVDAYRLDKKDKVQLPVLNQTNIPDFDYRIFGDYSHERTAGGDYYVSWRRRFFYDENVSALGGHTADQIIPLEKYYATPEDKEAHADWFWNPGSDGWQLCYTSEGMTKEYIERAKYFLSAKPNATEISFTDRDYPTWCKCERCVDVIKKYSAPGQYIQTATYILFLNKVTTALDAWLQEEYGGKRHVTYNFYAYQGAQLAPSHQDANGQYVPNGSENGDYSMVIKGNVRVQYAAVDADRNIPYKESVLESTQLRSWSALTPNLFIYEYPQDAYHSLLPYDGIHTHAENIRFAKELGHSAYKFQGNYHTQSSGFYNLRIYVISKLMWDCSLDPDKLAREYIKYCYGDASDVMQELYETMRDWFAYLRVKTNYGSNCLTNNLNNTHFPRNMMRRFEEIILSAYDEIEDLQYIDAELYEKIFRKIKIEQMWIDYVNLSNYSKFMSNEEKTQKINDFEKYAMKYNIKCWNQTASISIVIESWRKA